MRAKPRATQPKVCVCVCNEHTWKFLIAVPGDKSNAVKRAGGHMEIIYRDLNTNSDEFEMDERERTIQTFRIRIYYFYLSKI